MRPQGPPRSFGPIEISEATVRPSPYARAALTPGLSRPFPISLSRYASPPVLPAPVPIPVPISSSRATSESGMVEAPSVPDRALEPVAPDAANPGTPDEEQQEEDGGADGPAQNPGAYWVGA